eukprot:701629-Rhodomonas_salina.1
MTRMVPRVTDDHDVGDDVNDNKDPMTTVMKMMMMIEQRMRDHAMMPGLGTEIRWTAARREKERKIFDHFAEMYDDAAFCCVSPGVSLRPGLCHRVLCQCHPSSAATHFAPVLPSHATSALLGHIIPCSLTSPLKPPHTFAIPGSDLTIPRACCKAAGVPEFKGAVPVRGLEQALAFAQSKALTQADESESATSSDKYAQDRAFLAAFLAEGHAASGADASSSVASAKGHFEADASSVSGADASSSTAAAASNLAQSKPSLSSPADVNAVTSSKNAALQRRVAAAAAAAAEADADSFSAQTEKQATATGPPQAQSQQHLASDASSSSSGS